MYFDCYDFHDESCSANVSVYSFATRALHCQDCFNGNWCKGRDNDQRPDSLFAMEPKSVSKSASVDGLGENVFSVSAAEVEGFKSWPKVWYWGGKDAVKKGKCKDFKYIITFQSVPGSRDLVIELPKSLSSSCECGDDFHIRLVVNIPDGEGAAEKFGEALTLVREFLILHGLFTTLDQPEKLLMLY